MWFRAVLLSAVVAVTIEVSVLPENINGVEDYEREAIVVEAYRADENVRGREGRQFWGLGGQGSAMFPASTVPMSPMAQIFCRTPAGGFAFCNQNYQWGWPGSGGSQQWPGIQGQYPGVGGGGWPGQGQYPGIVQPQPQPQPTQPPLPTHPTHPPLPTHPPFITHPPTQAPVHVPAPTQPPAPVPVPTQPPAPAPVPTQPPPTTPKPTQPPVAAAVVGQEESFTPNTCGKGKYYPIRYNLNGSVAEEIERIEGEHPARIVNGWPADKYEWPWITALLNNGRQFCGGSLIDQKHILTAAHCVAHMSRYDVANLKVRLGEYQIKTTGETELFESDAERVVRHKGFSQQTLHTDVAIISLKTPVPVNQPHISPVCLPPQGGQSYAGQTATVIGWGSLKENGPQPNTLQEVTVKIWDNKVCKETYGPAAPGGIEPHMLCAGQKGKDSCSGDSGGPMQIGSGSTWMQIGVVSWGIGCGKSHYPGVYSRITELRDWIDRIRNEY